MNRLGTYKSKRFILTTTLLLMVVLPLINIRAASGIDILDIKAEDIDGKTIKIEWTTNIAARGKIIYGESRDDLSRFVVDNRTLRRHSVKIGNLKERTDYYYKIIAYNDSARARSFIKKVRTGEFHDEVPPKIFNARIAYVSGTAAVVEWETDKKATSRVEYGENRTYKKKAGSGRRSAKHMVVLKRLKPNTQYFLRFYSVDKDNNKSGIFHKEFITKESDKQDKEPLIISHLRPTGPDDSYISTRSIKIRFKTNRYAKGKVVLKKRGMRAKTETLDYGLDHSAVFSGLLPNTSYDIEVSMSDIFSKRARERFSAPTKKIIIDMGAADEVVMEEGEGDIIVLGEEYSYYTPAVALYRVIGSPHIYSIVKGRRYRIISASSFMEYGYNWSDVKKITPKALLKYPRVKLVKSPDKPAVYYLYERPGGGLLKIKIPSPAVFESYPGNSWADVVKVTQTDIDAIADAKLVKTKDDPAVYYLENGKKRYVSYNVFISRGFSFADVVEVNQKHLDSYKKGEDLKN
jgi:hypothetical protein